MAIGFRQVRGFLLLVHSAAALQLRSATLSNTRLPLDQHNRSLLTGEADILKHPTDGSLYFYFNNWGACLGVDCCSSAVGCRDCCFLPWNTTCVGLNNHSVVVYHTTDLTTWEYLGVALPAAARPQPRHVEYRPHVVYNALTKLYIMWYNDFVPSPKVTFRYGVAASPLPQGPFVVVNSSVTTHAGVKLGDLDILVDGAKAYLVHGDTNMAVEELNAEFTGTTGRFAPFAVPADKRHLGSEGPVMFKRKGVYYILPGTGCCACRGGSNMYVFTSTSPLGPYKYRGDAGSNTTHRFDAHSPWNYPTRAQASALVHLEGDTFLWMGNQWTTSLAPGRPRNHDLLYWWPLEFEPDGMVSQVRYEESVQVKLPPKLAYKRVPTEDGRGRGGRVAAAESGAGAGAGVVTSVVARVVAP